MWARFYAAPSLKNRPWNTSGPFDGWTLSRSLSNQGFLPHQPVSSTAMTQPGSALSGRGRPLLPACFLFHYFAQKPEDSTVRATLVPTGCLMPKTWDVLKRRFTASRHYQRRNWSRSHAEAQTSWMFWDQTQNGRLRGSSNESSGWVITPVTPLHWNVDSAERWLFF